MWNVKPCKTWKQYYKYVESSLSGIVEIKIMVVIDE